MLRTTNRHTSLLLVAALMPAPIGRVGRAEEGPATPSATPVEKAALDEAASALAKPKQEETKKGAAQQQRQQQIALLAQHKQRFVQPMLLAELELVRKTCGSLPEDARKTIVAAGDETVRSLARQLAERQFADQGAPGPDSRKMIREAVVAAVKPHATAEDFAAYEREQAARIARRVRAARIVIVTNLDIQLELSQSQRETIESDLEKHWNAGWLRYLDDHGIVTLNTFPPAPDFADSCIAPHLDDRQRAVWKKWCQQAGRSRMGHDVSNFGTGHSLQPDPWWSP